MNRPLTGVLVASVLLLVSISMKRISAPSTPVLPDRSNVAPAYSLVLPHEPIEGLLRGAPGSRSAPPPLGSVAQSPPSMLHLDARHTNRTPFLAPRSPVLSWTLDLGAPIAAAPVVADGAIIVATLGGNIAAITPDGATRWSIAVKERVYGSPLVIGNTIYVGVDAPPKPAKNGSLLMISATTGSIKARLEIEGDADTSITPLADGAGVVFAAGKTIVAARPDGTVIWRYKTRRKVFGSPAITPDGSVVVGTQDDAVIAIGKTGELRWQTAIGSDVDGAPAIADDGTIFVGDDAGELVALRPHDGAIVWRKQLGGFVRGPISIARDGTVLASTYGPVPAIVAIAPADGAEVWRYNIRGTGAKEFGIHGSPIEDPTGMLVFGTQGDHLIALDQDGAMIWTLSVGGDVDATVIVAADKRLYAGCDDGKLYAFDEQNR